MARTEPQIARRGSQVDDGAVLSEQAPVVFRPHRSTARSKHDVAFLDEFGQHLGLTRTETYLALDFENEWNLHPGRTLDLMVYVVEGLAQAAGEGASHGSLSGTHQTDEENAARHIG